MSVQSFDARHLSSNRNYQVQELQWYYIQIGDISDDLSLLVNTCSLPEISTPAVELPFGNSTAKVGGKIEYGDGSIAFMDAITIDVEKQLYDWHSQVVDPETGESGWVDEYKRDVLITQYGPHGENERIWHLEGAFPSSISYGEMSGESADKKTITVTLSYDRAYRE